MIRIRPDLQHCNFPHILSFQECSHFFMVILWTDLGWEVLLGLRLEPSSLGPTINQLVKKISKQASGVYTCIWGSYRGSGYED